MLWSVPCNISWFGGDKGSETLAIPSYSENPRVNKAYTYTLKGTESKLFCCMTGNQNLGGW